MSWIPPQPFPNIISLITYAFFIWFAIFILNVRPRRRSSVLASAAMLIVAIYIFQMIVQQSTSDKAAYFVWEKILWWASTFSPVVWLHTTLALLSEETLSNGASAYPAHDESVSLSSWNFHAMRDLFADIPVLVKWLLVLSYGVALFFGIAGTQGEWLFRFNQATYAAWPWSKWNVFYTPSGSYYYLFTIYVAINTLLSVVTLLLARERSRSAEGKKKYSYLLLGTFVFTAAAALLTLLNEETWALPEAVSHLLLAIGILIIGYAIAHYNALLEGRNIRERFLSDLLTLFPLLFVFLAAFVWLQPNPSMLALTVLVTFLITGYAFYERIHGAWQRKFMDPRLGKTKSATEHAAAELSDLQASKLKEWAMAANTLTKTERIVFDLYGRSLGASSIDELAAKAYRSASVLETHLGNIRKKFGCVKSAELAVIWLVLNLQPVVEEEMDDPALIR